MTYTNKNIHTNPVRRNAQADLRRALEDPNWAYYHNGGNLNQLEWEARVEAREQALREQAIVNAIITGLI